MAEKIPGIVGLGKAVGSITISTEEVLDKIDFSEWEKKRGENRASHNSRGLKAVARKVIEPTGVLERHWIGEGETTSTMAAEAINQACEMAGIDSSELKGITIATMSQDNGGTPASSMLQEKLGLANEGRYRDIAAACVGFVHALEIVYTNLTSPLGGEGPQAVVGAEVLSPLANPKDPQTYPLFGDAAGAAIVKMVPDKQGLFSKIAFVTGADGRYSEELGIRAGGSRVPMSHEALDRGDHLIHMNGPVVAREAVRRMSEYVEYAMEKANVRPGDLLLLIPHQANLELIKNVAKNLNFPIEKVAVSIDRMGNTSSASIPTAMRDAYDAGRLAPDSLIAICSFAAGMNFGAAVIPTAGLPDKK
jgi:3-oxoacyl-[acyl-carrier-protein] synthase-3